MYKHFIITRFNLKYEDIPGFEEYNLPVQTEEWLDKRFNLFDKYCFPSIINQTCKNFIWFVLFSSNTPERFIKKIGNYELIFPLFKPLFLEAGDSKSIKKILNEAIDQYLEIDDQYVITSRVDNDDAFHKEMVSEVQRFFDKQDNVFLSFTYGLQYEIERKVLSRMHYEKNHFVSRIEKRVNFIETVITPDHTEIDKFGKVFYLNEKNKPLWIEVIHGGNLANRLYSSSVPLFFNAIKESFNFEVQTSMANTLLMYFKYLKLETLLLRANILQKIGIYNFLKRLLKKQ